MNWFRTWIENDKAYLIKDTREYLLVRVCMIRYLLYITYELGLGMVFADDFFKSVIIRYLLNPAINGHKILVQLSNYLIYSADPHLDHFWLWYRVFSRFINIFVEKLGMDIFKSNCLHRETRHNLAIFHCLLK